jgi:hypothetical protein
MSNNGGLPPHPIMGAGAEAGAQSLLEEHRCHAARSSHYHEDLHAVMVGPSCTREGPVRNVDRTGFAHCRPQQRWEAGGVERGEFNTLRSPDS